MSYGLSFSEEFFVGNGEYDYYKMPASATPTSVLQAVVTLDRDELSKIGVDVFGYTQEVAEIWADSESCAMDIVDKVRQTDTCDSLQSPVNVYIDSDGFYSLSVYDTMGD